MNLKNLSAYLTAFLLVLLVSCASPLSEPTPTPIPATPTPLPPPISPEFPTGIFYHSHPPNHITYCVFQFNEDGTFTYYWYISSLDLSSRKPQETGTYRIDGNLYTVTSTDLTWCPAPITYTWTYDGQNLTFQVFGEDTCTDRKNTYESPYFYTRLK